MKMKRFAMLMLSSIIVMTSVMAVPAFAGVLVADNDDLGTAISPVKALQVIGVDLDLNTDDSTHARFDRSDDQQYEVRVSHLRSISANQPLAIASEADARVLLDALEVVVTQTDNPIFIDSNIMDALEKAGLSGYFEEGIRALFQEEREEWLLSLLKNYTVDELLELNDAGVLVVSEILVELKALNLSCVVLGGQIQQLAMHIDTAGIVPFSTRISSQVPNNTRVHGLWLPPHSLLFGPGEAISFSVTFRLAAGSPGGLEIGNFAVHREIFESHVNAGATASLQTRSGTMVPRHHTEFVFALRAQSNPILVSSGWWHRR